MQKMQKKKKKNWFQGKEEEAEKEHFSGMKVWKCIRDMQDERRRLSPSRVVSHGG